MELKVHSALKVSAASRVCSAASKVVLALMESELVELAVEAVPGEELKATLREWGRVWVWFLVLVMVMVM